VEIRSLVLMLGWFRDQGGDGPDDLNLFGGGRSNFLLKLAQIRRVEGYLYLLLSLNMFLKSSANNRFGVVYNFESGCSFFYPVGDAG